MMHKSYPVRSVPGQALARSRRADILIDIIFVVHTAMNFQTGTVVVLLILDADAHHVCAQGTAHANTNMPRNRFASG